jgi:glycosyltransferase involved in cell wall biosynthesis
LRILFVNDYYFSVTGSSIANRNLCRQLSKRGINCIVLTSSKPEGKSFDERVYLLPTLVSSYPSYLAAPLLWRIKKIISIEQPHIIHLQTLSLISLMVLWIARRKGIPIVAGIHDLPRNIAVYFRIGGGFVSIISQRILSYFLSSVNVAVAPSEFAKTYYRQRGVQTDICVISNGVDLSVFNPLNPNTQIFSKMYLSKTDSAIPRVIFAGRVTPDKDLEVMIEATRDIHVIPIIVGPAWPRYLRKLKMLSSEKAIFTGYIDSSLLTEAYNSCDVFVQPSTAELQSLVILEAMACGLPVIGANSGPIPELIVNGINGYLFEPYKAQDLRKKIELLLDNDTLRKEMRAASIRMAQKHSLRQTADEYIKLYTEYVK